MFNAIKTAGKNFLTSAKVQAELGLYIGDKAFAIESFGTEGLKVTVTKLDNVGTAETVCGRIARKTGCPILVAF